MDNEGLPGTCHEEACFFLLRGLIRFYLWHSAAPGAVVKSLEVNLNDDNDEDSTSYPYSIIHSFCYM